MAAFNVVTVLFMLAVGYSDRVDPVAHPLVANVGLLFPVFLVLNMAFLVFWLVFCKRGALIALGGLVVCFGPVRTYTPLNVPSSAPEGALKVISYNVYCFKTWTDFTQSSEILDYLVREDADIVCMQEGDCYGRVRELVDSVMNAHYEYSEQHASDGPEGGDLIRIYSKLPIVGHERISGKETYNAMAYKVKTGERDTTLVVVAHLQTTGLSPEDRTRFKSMLKGDMEGEERKQETRRLWSILGEASAKRVPQVDAVADYVAKHKGQSIILTGDFNDSPISYAHRRLASSSPTAT